MAVLSMLSAAVADKMTVPGGIPWEWLILKVFDFVANYGWRIVLFTVLLKLVLLPLDIYQKHCMRKNQRITERLKPEMEKLQRAYGNDKQAFAQKQMELNKREGFSYFSSCLPAILTLVIFIWLWRSMTTISQYMILKQYVEWDDRYQLVQGYVLNEDFFGVTPNRDSRGFLLDEEGNRIPSPEAAEGETDEYKLYLRDARIFYNADGSATDADKERVKGYVRQAIDAYNAALPEEERISADESALRPGMAADWVEDVRETYARSLAQQAVAEFYAGEESNRESFLWIANVWRPDVPWQKPIGDYKSFLSSIGKYAKNATKLNITNDELQRLVASENYNSITAKLASQNQRANGYLVLPILSIAFSFLSYFISQRQQKKAGQAPAEGAMGGGTMKFMMFLMPVMMGVFALTYSAAFTLYIVVNSSTTIIVNLLSSFILNMQDRHIERKAVTTVQRHGRPDPNAPIGKKDVKRK